MAKNKILRDYSHKSDGQLGDFTLHVATSLTGNATLVDPPTPPGNLTTQGNEFIIAVAACLNGTPLDTVNKNNVRTALLATLDNTANYVELIAKGDELILRSSGFEVTSASRSQAVPTATAILAVINVATTKLGLNLQTAHNAWAYVVEYTALPGGAVKTKTFTNPRDAVLEELTPGTLYSIRAQVMGSNNQTTNWSDAVQHMST